MEQYKKERQSNFELLRIISILMIITLHYFNGSMGGALDTNNLSNSHFNYYLVRFGESLCIVAVNCFILITGYFMYKSNTIKLRKVFNLVFTLIFYNVLLCTISIVLKIPGYDTNFYDNLFKSFFSDGAWFVIIYIILYLLVPYINLVIKNINKKQHGILITIMLIVFSVYPTFIDNITILDNGNGIISFIMLYFIGSYINKYNINKRKIWIYLIFYILMQAMTYILAINDYNKIYPFAYNTIFNVLGSVFLFLAFSKLNIKSKIINKISKHTLGIYLMHVNIFIRVYMWRTILKTGEYYTRNSLILNCVFSVLAVFIGGLIIDFIREKLFNVTIEKILKNNKIYNYELKIE